MSKLQNWLNRVPGQRTQTALRGIFSQFLTDNDPMTFKTIAVGGDGTTGFEVASTFTGVTGILIAGTASADGISITGVCADGIHISGAMTAAGLHISGDQVDAILIDGDAAANNAIRILVDDGITIGTGINIDRTGTTGICTTGISIDTDGTTGIEIAAGFTGVTGITIAGTASGDGILVSGACADAIHISGANTASGLHISGDQVIGILYDITAAATDGLKIAVPTGITLTTGINMVCAGTGTITNAISLDYSASATECIAITVATTKTITTGMSLSGAGTYTTGILLDATAITTGISISAGSMTDAILISGTTPVDGIEISSACSVAAINISGANATGIVISGANTAAGINISGDQVVGLLFESTAAADAALRVTVPTGITLGAGLDVNCTSTGIVTSGLTLQGTGTFTTGITLTATTITTGIKIGSGATTAIDIDCVTDTTSAVTGSIHTDGGVGIAKALWVGTTMITGVGAVGAPSVQIGAADTGLYLVSAVQTGFSQDGVLVALFDADGIKPDSVQVRTALGTTPVGTVTIKEYGDGRDITTVLTLTAFIIGAPGAAAAAKGFGNVVYTFPAGQHLELVSAFSAIVLTAAGTAVASDTGLGSVVASGVISVLSGTTTFEDRLTGQTINTAAGGGAAVSALLAATAGIGTGISLNVAASVKDVFLNSAGTWNADNTGNLTATGTIVLKWTLMG